MIAAAEKRHTDRAFEAELNEVREALLVMAGRVELMIASAVEAFEKRDVALARATVERDAEVNRAEMDIDEMCLVILARRQPMGRDLRFLTLALKMVTDLERIADLAVNVCERAIQLTEMGPVIERLGDEIPRMGGLVRAMVREAIDAFIAQDASRAREVVALDDEIDELYHAIFRAVLARMVEDPSLVERGIHVQSVAKFLERMGDHGTNLAEHVVLLVKGKDIRHIGKL
jgi:phosphate transport system protein